jgi:orotidine-5'-phosphate decarboxylase
MTFAEKLLQAGRRNDSLLCIGLDTDLERIPRCLLREKDPVLTFNRAIIEATSDLVCAYKPNAAFYEAMGERGWGALAATRKMVPDSIPAIIDAKRGDIGNTARLYARAYLRELNFDAITVNPYMGFDAVAPFLEYPGRCALILCLTSNPSAGDIQGLSADGWPVFEHVARRAVEWSRHGLCGLVAGATRVDDLRRIRRVAPRLPILIPGVGAQGGDLERAVAGGVDDSGELAMINAARSVLYASGDRDFAERARQEAMVLRDAINRARRAGRPSGPE